MTTRDQRLASQISPTIIRRGRARNWQARASIKFREPFDEEHGVAPCCTIVPGSAVIGWLVLGRACSNTCSTRMGSSGDVAATWSVPISKDKDIARSGKKSDRRGTLAGW